MRKKFASFLLMPKHWLRIEKGISSIKSSEGFNRIVVSALSPFVSVSNI